MLKPWCNLCFEESCQPAILCYWPKGEGSWHSKTGTMFIGQPCRERVRQLIAVYINELWTRVSLTAKSRNACEIVVSEKTKARLRAAWARRKANLTKG